MPRILHLVASQFVGGSEKQLIHHAYDTRSADYDVVLGSFQEQAEPAEMLTVASRHGIETASIPGGVRPALVEDLAQYLRLGHIDLLCTHGYKANVVGHFAAKQAHVSWVPFVRNWSAESIPVNLYERLEQSILVRSPWVVCGSSAQARQLGRLRRGRPAPLVIQNSVLTAREGVATRELVPTREELGISPQAFIFGATGRFSREKGHRHLLDAFALLRRMIGRQDMNLLLVGEGGEEPNLRAQARRLGIETSVCFAGAQRKASAWMKLMDCMVHASSAEGTPNSLLEAMVMGVPVIAAAGGGIADIIQNEQTGLLVQASAHIPMAEAMKKMVRSATLRKELIKHAREAVDRNFSPRRQRTLLEMLYKTLLGDAFPIEVEDYGRGVA